MTKSTKQETLPTMQDKAIKELEDAAIEYVEIRDERMNLTEQESDLKVKLLALMKKHNKETYRCNGIEVRVVHEEETVKVKIHRESEKKEKE